MEIPETHYAKSGELSIAYQVVGEGDLDIVFVPGWVSHVELNWEDLLAPLLTGLSRFGRLIVFDKRGTGLSDRTLGLGTLEERMEDVHAVMDAVGSERAALFGVSEGGPMSLLFAATYPTRAAALVLYGSYARVARSDDYPLGVDRETVSALVDLAESQWGTGIPLGGIVPGTTDDFLKLAARFERNASTPHVAAEAMRRNIEIDVRAVLPAIAIPTLVMHHRHDPFVPFRWGRYVAENIAGARLLELPGALHLSWHAEDYDPALEATEVFLTGSVSSPDVDRVLATVMFTDIVSSTERAAALGDRKWHDLLQQHDRVVDEAIRRHRGRRIKHTGDGVFAAFDGPARAVRCARAIVTQARLKGMEVRAGVHTGECEARGDDLFGMAVNIGARVAALAGPGEVLVSSTVKDLVVGSGIEFEDRGEHDLKGVTDRWRLLAVTAA